MPRNDEAPKSSARARVRLVRGLSEEFAALVDTMAITTRVDTGGHRYRAVTTVDRPCMGWALSRRDEFDRQVLEALRLLPGADSGVIITMGRTYTVTWDGICAPV